MHGSKLLELMKRLDKRQLSRFADFTASPYFNKREDVADFCQLLVSFQPSFDSKVLSKEAFYAKLYPAKKFDEKHLGYLMSWLLKLSEEFIAVEHARADKADAYLRLMGQLSIWQLDKHYRSVTKTVEKDRQQLIERNANHYLQAFRFDSIRNAHFDRKRQHVPDDNLKRASDSLDIFYLSQKLRYSCELINRRQWVSGDSEIELLPQLLAYLKSRDFSKVPAISIYQQIHSCLTEPELEENFVALREQLVSLGDAFDFQETRDVFSYAYNYCIGQINKGKQAYHSELLNLFKLALKRELLFDSGKLSPWTYKNIVTVACRSGELDWADQFINKYKEYIPSDFRKNAVAYNKAYLLFNRKAFEDALGLLQQVEFTDLYYALDSKTVLLKIYYEIKEWAALRSLLNSFRIYLKRNKQVAEGYRNLYLNLIIVTRELMRESSAYAGLQPKKRGIDITDLRKRVSEMAVADKQWLLEKIEVVDKASLA